MIGTANLVQPNWFFISQFFTLGESDLSDLELIYMTPVEGALFFLLESIYLPWQQLPAIVFCMLFWWLYAADFVWFSVDFLVFVLGGGIDSYREVSVQYFQPKEVSEETLQQVVDAVLAKYDLDGDN